MRAKPWVGPVLAATVVLMLTGCVATAPLGSPGSSSSDRDSESSSAESFGSIADFEADYTRGVDQLIDSLPPGVEFPAGVPGSWEEDAAFERGAGEMQAALYWQCSWLNAYSSAKESNDALGQVEALDKLDAWITLPAVKPNVDDTSRAVWTSEYVEPAREGRDDNLLSLLPC
jgi:hypothetical protein